MNTHIPKHLEHLRHTLSHLMAAAVLEIRPDALPTLGPAIENGFYYDFDFPTPITDTDLLEIEKLMKKLLPTWKEFTHREVTKEEALEQFKENPYKQELIEEIVSRGEKLTLYTCGKFTDLCRGGHVEHPNKDIDPNAFKLSHIAGAYWRGNEKNKMLSRVYGLAFESKKDLDEYIKQTEEAKKRDHKKLGKELDLFFIDEKVGKGLPMWTPKGTALKFELENFTRDLERKYGYEHALQDILITIQKICTHQLTWTEICFIYAQWHALTTYACFNENLGVIKTFLLDMQK